MALNDSLINRAVALQLDFQAKRAGMSQQQIADATGVSLTTVQRMFSGKNEIKIGYLTAVCAAINTTPAEIMNRAFSIEGEEAIYADVQKRFGLESLVPPVSGDAVSVTSIEEARGRRNDAHLTSTEEVEQMLADDTKQIAANRDEEANTDESPST